MPRKLPGLSLAVIRWGILFAERRGAGCLGLVVGLIAGAAFGLAKVLITPFAWTSTGTSIWGTSFDAFQQQVDHADDALDWCLRLIGNVLSYAITWSVLAGVIALVASWLVRFAIWFKNNITIR
jgi:hypothetical protein